MAGELMNDGKYIYINTPYAEMYIPEEIIDTPTGDPKPSSVAYEYGTGFVTMGIAYMRFFKDPNANRDSVKVSTLVYPNLIETHPSDSTKGVDLMINGKADRYRILKYEHGDVLMEATSRKSSQNCEMFMRLISSGKIPNSLSYDEIYQAWMDNYSINGMSPNAPAVVLQAIIGEMCRDPKDPSKAFRHTKFRDQRSYKAISIKDLPKYISPNSSINSENWDLGVIGAIMNPTDADSPLERLLMG